MNKKALVVILFLALLISGFWVKDNLYIDDDIYLNDDKVDSTTVIIIIRNGGQDTVVIIDTLGTLRFSIPYVIDSIHTSDSLKTRIIFCNNKAMVKQTTTRKSLEVLNDQDYAAHISAIQDTGLLVSAGQSWGLIVTVTDSLSGEFNSAMMGVISKVAVTDTIFPNNSYAFYGTAEDSFGLWVKAGYHTIYAEACSSGALVAYFQGDNGIMVTDTIDTIITRPDEIILNPRDASDSSATNSPPVEFISKGDTATGNNVAQVSQKIYIQARGTFAGDGVLPNYWLSFRDSSAVGVTPGGTEIARLLPTHFEVLSATDTIRCYPTKAEADTGDFDYVFGDGSGLTNVTVLKILEFSFNEEGQSYLRTLNTTYTVMGSFIFRGTNEIGTPTKIAIVGHTTADSVAFRIYDYTNSQTIAETTQITNATKTIININTISNVPATEAIWEIQMYKTGLGATYGYLHALGVHF